MGLFGRKKKKQQTEYNLADFDMQEILGDKSNTVNDKMFDKISRAQYIRTQCEQILESSKYVEDSKKEYTSVTEHLSDIQKLDELEDDQRQVISETAEDMFKLNHDRTQSRNKKSRLPGAKFDYYLLHETELEEALKKMQNDEQYFQMIKKDLNMLEAEKVGLREDIEKSVIRQENIRNLSIIALVAVIAVFVVLIATGRIVPEGNNYVLTVLLFVMTVIVAVLFLFNRNAVYTLKLSEKKLNRAIVLQNKVKIKYINIVNSVEYQYAKYGVANSYEFSSTYQMFLEDKREREQYAKTTGRLGKATDKLSSLLAGIGLRDTEIWQGQLEALFNPKEMVEVRHNLNVRRQKLREQMEYNMKRIEEAKRNVTSYTKKNPQFAQEIMEIVDSYDMEV